MSEPEDEDGSDPPGGAPAWMATMADMMSLLLTFFVLLLSFANTDIVKFRMMLGSVRDAFGVQNEHPGELPALTTSVIALSKQESTPFLESLQKQNRPSSQAPPPMEKELAEEVGQAVAQLDIGKLVEVETDKRGVVVRVKGQLLFASGSANLLPESLVFLDELGRLVKAFPYDVAIEGHTDDQPIVSPLIPSNWHLSVLRAVSTLRYVQESSGVRDDRLSAGGYGDTRPIVANDSPTNRATNRRVEFVFMR